MTPYKVPSLRAASSVSQAGAGKRLTSADGSRWAISRNQKRSLSGGRFDVVECWTLRHRDAQGKVITHSLQRSEESAREWVA